MSLYYEAYDYKKEKQNNSKSEAYNKVAQLFTPYEYLFFKDWIIDQYFAHLPQEFSPLDVRWMGPLTKTKRKHNHACIMNARNFTKRIVLKQQIYYGNFGIGVSETKYC